MPAIENFKGMDIDFASLLDVEAIRLAAAQSVFEPILTRTRLRDDKIEFVVEGNPTRRDDTAIQVEWHKSFAAVSFEPIERQIRQELLRRAEARIRTYMHEHILDEVTKHWETTSLLSTSSRYVLAVACGDVPVFEMSKVLPHWPFDQIGL